MRNASAELEIYVKMTKKANTLRIVIRGLDLAKHERENFLACNHSHFLVMYHSYDPPNKFGGLYTGSSLGNYNLMIIENYNK
jgi:hypothetical protein